MINYTTVISEKVEDLTQNFLKFCCYILCLQVACAYQNWKFGLLRLFSKKWLLANFWIHYSQVMKLICVHFVFINLMESSICNISFDSI